MARTKHHSKKHGSVKKGEGRRQRGYGYDYGAARPGNCGTQGFGPAVKRKTHKLERLNNKKTTHKELKEVSHDD